MTDPLRVIFTLLLAAHIGAGATALVSFWVPVAGVKGGAVHRRWGRIFATAIYVAGVAAIGMALCSLADPLGLHPGLTDAALYRGLFGWMMLYLGLLTISMTRYGLAMVANKRNHGANRGLPMIVLQVAVLVAAVNCAWHGALLGQPLMIGVSLIGFGTTLTYLWYMVRASPARGSYLGEHLKAMVATGIASYTAFLSVGLVGVFPQHAFNPWLWALPTVVGMGVIINFLRKRVAPARTPREGLP
jgi:hypothetical protein